MANEYQEENDRGMAFTTLAELKGWINALSEHDLHAIPNESDWFEIYIQYNHGPAYFHIQPKTGGDE